MKIIYFLLIFDMYLDKEIFKISVFVDCYEIVIEGNFVTEMKRDLYFDPPTRAEEIVEMADYYSVTVMVYFETAEQNSACAFVTNLTADYVQKNLTPHCS